MRSYVKFNKYPLFKYKCTCSHVFMFQYMNNHQYKPYIHSSLLCIVFVNTGYKIIYLKIITRAQSGSFVLPIFIIAR